jgi:hypothetical protein
MRKQAARETLLQYTVCRAPKICAGYCDCTKIPHSILEHLLEELPFNVSFDEWLQFGVDNGWYDPATGVVSLESK